MRKNKYTAIIINPEIIHIEAENTFEADEKIKEYLKKNNKKVFQYDYEKGEYNINDINYFNIVWK